MVLTKIDELTQWDHHYINENDNCFYFAEYPSGDVNVNKTNPIYSLVHNLKKPIDRINYPEYKYKLNAIKICTNALKQLFDAEGNIEDFTLVPIPPSKTKQNPLYDDRMVRILKGLEPLFSNVDVKELISTLEDREPSHYVENNRPSIEEVYNNYIINEDLLISTKNKIILFDDVLTNGTHYCACRRKILDYLPNTDVYGFFIARRVFPVSSSLIDFSDWE